MFDIVKKIWKVGTVTEKNPFIVPSNKNNGGEITETDLGRELKKKINKVLGGSLHIRHLDTGSCNGCEFEMGTLSNPVYDIARFGVSFVPSPRQADMLMVTGGVTRNLLQALEITYAATPQPKIIMAVGECACNGGAIGETYANFGGIDKFVPVFIYVQDCPPTPRALMQGILTALDKYEKASHRGEDK
jgi:Ni,Fe-hydrogenase III small subunit